MDLRELIQLIPPDSGVITCGLPASGKSTLSRLIARDKGHVIISTDELRLKLLREEDIFDKEKAKDLKVRFHVYEAMFNQARMLIRAGKHIILDGTFIKNELRREAAKIFLEANIKVMIIMVICDQETSLKRIDLRKNKPYESNAIYRDAYFNNVKEWEGINLEDISTGFPNASIECYKVFSEDIDTYLWKVKRCS